MAALCMVGAVSLAQDFPTPSPELPAIEATSYAVVKVAGRPLFSLMGANGLSAEERADKVNRRLDSLILRSEPLPAFTRHEVVTHGLDTTIMLDGEPILNVTDGDAQDALTTCDDLAYQWAQRMVDAVNQERAVHSNPITGSGILIRNSLSDMIVSIFSWLPRLVGAVIMISFFAVFAKFNRWALRPLIQRANVDSNLRHLIRALIYYGTWVCGLFAALTTLGLSGTSLATTIGISGFVLGFAFKDILSQLFAGLMLLMGQQFHVGDQIVVKEFEGAVEKIELRALYLRTYDNRLVIIPNGDVITSAVISNTDSPFRRREFVIRVSYGDNTKEAQRVAIETIMSVEGVAPDPAPEVLVDELSATTVNLKARFHTHSHRADYLRVDSECMLRVKEALEQHHISMPSSTLSVTIENLESTMSSAAAAETPPAAAAAPTTPPPAAGVPKLAS